MIVADPSFVEKHGGKLWLNCSSSPTFSLESPLAVDVETDEKDNFVGMAWTSDGIDIHYCISIPSWLGDVKNLVGHNLKADIKWLKGWGVNIKPSQIYYDTMLASYVQDPTKEKHGLKDVAKAILGIEYPSYREIVGKGRTRQTLDKLPVELVANYCGMDVLSTFRLYQHFETKLTGFQHKQLQEVEMPLMRLLYQMELEGIQVNTTYLEELRTQLETQIQKAERTLKAICPINWNSPQQVGKVLKLQSTDKKFLATDNRPIVKNLLNYRELKKLKSTYVDALLEKHVNGRIHTSFNQLIDTGRLSSYGPNLQNIPTRTERGDQLRKAFIAKEGHVLIDADYDQIEYRLLAHFTQEPVLLEAFKNGKDIHQETANLLGVSRYLGKTLNFAAIYGAQARKISQTVNQASEAQEKITEEDAARFLESYWRRLPRVKLWIDKIKRDAKQNGTFQTISGQHYKLKYIYDKDKYKRWYSERQAVNGTIQGSAAYVIKRAMILLEPKITPILQVHDELLFEVPHVQAANGYCEGFIGEVMEGAIELSVPLKVSIGVGKNWQEAKV